MRDYAAFYPFTEILSKVSDCWNQAGDVVPPIIAWITRKLKRFFINPLLSFFWSIQLIGQFCVLLD